jgi:hypothetical protein
MLFRQSVPLNQRAIQSPLSQISIRRGLRFKDRKAFKQGIIK